MNAQRRTAAARWGWALIGLAIIGLSLWVVGKALGAHTPEAFSRWTGWANILALPVAAMGVALVLIDRSKPAKSVRPAKSGAPAPSIVQHITPKRGNAQGVINGNIINYPGPPSAFAPETRDHTRSPENPTDPEAHG
jgi:hypothetical protein